MALGCVLLLPATLHLLLCPSPAFTAPTTAIRHPLPYPRYTRGDPLLGLGLFTGFSHHLSLTPQDTPLSPQPLDDLSLALMQRPPANTFPPLSEPLYQPEDLPATQDLRDLSDFSLSDLDLLQGILGDLENGSGRQKGSIGLREKGRSSCRGYVVSGDVWCPSTLLQVRLRERERERERKRERERENYSCFIIFSTDAQWPPLRPCQATTSPSRL